MRQNIKKVTLTLRRSKQSESWWVRTSDYSPAAVWGPHTRDAAPCDQHSRKIDPTHTLTRGLDGGILGTKCMVVRVTIKVHMLKTNVKNAHFMSHCRKLKQKVKVIQIRRQRILQILIKYVLHSGRAGG